MSSKVKSPVTMYQAWNEEPPKEDYLVEEPSKEDYPLVQEPSDSPIEVPKQDYLEEPPKEEEAPTPKEESPQEVKEAKEEESKKPDKIVPQRLMNVLNNSNFGILQQIEDQFTSTDLSELQQISDFKGLDDVYEKLSIEFEKI
eukprot:250630_1